MRIAMIGAGYVGLVSGACLAEFGHEVVCVDRDPGRIAGLNAGRIPIHEPGLDALVADTTRAGRLAFRTDMAEAVAGADAVFIAVGTPSRRGDGFADLTYVYQAAREIAAHLTGFTVVVTKSTVPVGTGDEVERVMREERPDADVAVASNPEFLREGAAIADFKRPDRVVVGTHDPRAEAVLREVYRPLTLNAAPVYVMGRREAELTKYAANAFLATKITFINEIADLCEAVGADVQAVARGIGLDRRIGPKFLHAGPGYGGSCFPKDTLALAKTAQDAGVSLRIVEAVAAVNEGRKRAMARKVIRACGGSVRGRTIALLGLTFKPDTDDMREAPSLAIVAGLVDAGARVRAHDPEGMDQARLLMPDIAYAPDPYSCAEGADAVVIVTEWNAYRALDLARLRAGMAQDTAQGVGQSTAQGLAPGSGTAPGPRAPALVDLRNIYDPAAAAAHGFTYTGVGRIPSKNYIQAQRHERKRP